MLQDAQIGREACGLHAPVEHQRFGRHHQRWALAFHAPLFEKREHLGRLANAHIVSQAAAETELAEEVHPTDALALIVAHYAAEAFRLRRGSYALEVAEPLACTFEDLVDLNLGLRRQQRVQQSGLVLSEAQVVFFTRPQIGDGREAGQPLLRQHAEGEVVQRPPPPEQNDGREDGPAGRRGEEQPEKVLGHLTDSNAPSAGRRGSSVSA